MGPGKPVVLGLSILLVVGIAIGLIVSVHNISSKDDSEDPFASTSKAVAAICSQMDYQRTCIDSLSSIAFNETATPKDFLAVAINVTIDAVKTGMERSGVIAKGVNEPRQKMAFEDCNELLTLAIHELQAAFASVGDAQNQTVVDRVDELRNWHSATISNQQSCLDGVTQPELKDKMEKNLLNYSQLTSNALAMVTEVTNIIKSISDIQVNMTTTSDTSRQLVDTTSDCHDRFPGWLTRADRKLLTVQPVYIEPDMVVAQDGSGQFKTITDALRACPKGLKRRFVIYVKAGIYEEQIIIEDLVNILMYGDGPRKTLVRGNKSFADNLTTYKTATFAVIGDGFICRSMGFQNVAGPEGHQAVALRVQSDRSAFYNVRVDGYQDSLYAQTNRQFYRNCVISGTVDFIFGDSPTLIQNSLIIVRKPLDGQKNTVTAQGRTDPRGTTGITIHNCRVLPEQKLYPLRFDIQTYLGRPWKTYSRTVIMESTLADFIQPAGWLPWAGNFALDTLFYREYRNRGPGGNTNNRVDWKGYGVIKSRNEALRFTAGPFLQGRLWIPSVGVPYMLGLRF